MATVQTCCRHICISRSIPARPPIKQVRLKRNASSAHRFALEGNGHRISLGGHFRHHLGRIRSAFHAGHLLLHPFNISHHCRHSIYPPFRVWCCHCTWTVIKGKIARGYESVSAWCEDVYWHMHEKSRCAGLFLYMSIVGYSASSKWLSHLLQACLRNRKLPQTFLLG